MNRGWKPLFYGFLWKLLMVYREKNMISTGKTMLKFVWPASWTQSSSIVPFDRDEQRMGTTKTQLINLFWQTVNVPIDNQYTNTQLSSTVNVPNFLCVSKAELKKEMLFAPVFVLRFAASETLQAVIPLQAVTSRSRLSRRSLRRMGLPRTPGDWISCSLDVSWMPSTMDRLDSKKCCNS